MWCAPYDHLYYLLYYSSNCLIEVKVYGYIQWKMDIVSHETLQSVKSIDIVYLRV